MRLLVILLISGCATAGGPSLAGVPGQPAASEQVLPAGIYEIRVAPGGPAAGMPALRILLTADGRSTVTDGTTTHVVGRMNHLGNEQIEMLDESGPAACLDSGPVAGRYRVRKTAEGYELHAVDDACTGRRGALNGNTLVPVQR